MNQVEKIKNNIDPTIVTSTVVAALLIGAIALVAGKAGLRTVAKVAKGG